MSALFSKSSANSFARSGFFVPRKLNANALSDAFNTADASGSLVTAMWLQAPSIVACFSALLVSFWMPSLTSFLASAGFAAIHSVVSMCARRKLSTTSGCSSRKSARAMTVVVGN